MTIKGLLTFMLWLNSQIPLLLVICILLICTNDTLFFLHHIFLWKPLSSFYSDAIYIKIQCFFLHVHPIFLSQHMTHPPQSTTFYYFYDSFLQTHKSSMCSLVFFRSRQFHTMCLSNHPVLSLFLCGKFLLPNSHSALSILLHMLILKEVNDGSP